VDAVSQAIAKVERNEVDPLKLHAKVKEMYSWSDVAVRTEKVSFT
jgi:hypothetical protein